MENECHTAVLHDGKVYIGGGYGSPYKINIYTFANNSWNPSPISISFNYFALTTLNNQLITAGGMDRSNKVTNKIFSLDGDHLKKYTRIITPRCWATAAGHQGALIIAGGEDDKYKKIATTELFNSTTRQWYSTGDLPLPHSHLKSVIIHNVLYLLGGDNDKGFFSQAMFAAPLDTLSSNQLKWNIQDTPCTNSFPVSILGRHLLTVSLETFTCSTRSVTAGKS